ncbi:MAG: CheR family methyltransferase [Isosphaeraceae bacterium]
MDGLHHPGVGPEPWSDDDFRPVAAVLRRGSAALSPQRLSLIRSRLQIRLQDRGMPGFTWFYEHELARSPAGAGMQMLVDLTTINHSAFFREPVPLRALCEHLAGLLRSRPGPVRAWSAGCSAGQEPYSLAILLGEIEPTSVPPPGRLEIWASDVSLGMVRAGARAVYEARELADLGPDRLRRSFLRGRGPNDGFYRVVPEIRSLVTFQHLDLRRADWPIPGDFDAILWRNVAIYFDEGERLAMLDRMAGMLRDGGWLVVGTCEILPERPGLLRKIAPAIFRKEART